MQEALFKFSIAYYFRIFPVVIFISLLFRKDLKLAEKIGLGVMLGIFFFIAPIIYGFTGQKNKWIKVLSFFTLIPLGVIALLMFMLVGGG